MGRDCGLWAAIFCSASAPLSSFGEGQVLTIENCEAPLPKLFVDVVRSYFVVVSLFLCFATHGAAVKHHEAPATPQRPEDMVDHRFRIGEFVIGVRNEHRVYRSDRQVWIIRISYLHMHIALTSEDRPNPKKCEREPPNIHGEDFAGPPDISTQL